MPTREEAAIESVPLAAWDKLERDSWSRLEFVNVHTDHGQVWLLAGLAVVALGEESARRGIFTVFAAPRWLVERWISARLGAGPRLARAMVSAALGAPENSGATLRAVAGRLEVHVSDPIRRTPASEGEES
jgi:hypothetical protein